ncbi:CpXC domain-containing protein [Caproiciproducens galactitolivorans]|uniref:CpXC domain-containing protein n=1 Tax=Caproiciproducens galactitolivorans TaxID=642589 RepID=A0ABT4BW79_9FIRM|nr:CpXC domain-containing protein [Caproiciproducens galactitolivorans]MCY1715149.1 CpXC domain-containing protein [Caproiciproducens galactitolivorans]
MATQDNRDVSCPHCGAVVKTQVHPELEAGEDPELRLRVLDETLFDWKCPECGYEAQLVYPCLYHDKSKNFMVYVVPNGGCRSLDSVKVGEAFPQLCGVTKRVVVSPAQLKEKILIFEAGLNDFAVELVKLAVTDVAAKKHGKVVTDGYFCYADEAENRIGFSFFLKGNQEPVQQRTRMDVYKKSLEITQSVGVAEQDEFMAVDSAAAEKILRVYRGEEE